MTNNAIEEGVVRLQIDLLEKQIAAQANVFDQIDSKTGVALGFMSVLLGQICAAVIKMVSEGHRLPISCWYLTHIVFGLSLLFILLTMVFGFMARIPRVFCGVEAFSLDYLNSKSERMIREELERRLRENMEKNEEANIAKAKWAFATYILAGTSLVAVLLFSALIFFQSVG